MNKGAGDQQKSVFKSIIQKGGIRFKLALVMLTFVAGTVSVLYFVIFPRQEAVLREKAFDVCEVSAFSLSSVAGEALLTDQVILLDDIIRGIQEQHVEGLREISVIYKDRYFVHSEPGRRKAAVESDVLNRAQSATRGRVRREEIVYSQDGRQRSAYEFLTPIVFQDRVIGFTRIVYDAGAIHDPIQRIRNLAAVVGAVTILSSFGIIFLVSGRMAHPILEIAGAARRVGEGDLDTKVDIHSLDEIGILAERFNRMVLEMKERFHMSKFLSGSAMKMIQSRVGDQEMQLGGSRQDTAFFFSDVRGFTAWSEKTSPEKVVQVLNKYLDLQTNIIQKFGGDIDKYVGDEIMAIFTGPDKEDHCLHAAVAVMQMLKKFNDLRDEKGMVTLNLGIGCHCGEVVVGNMGSSSRMDFTAIGDVVNLSARLCSAAGAGQIITTEEMLSRVGKRYRLEPMDPIQVKGKKEPIRIARVVSVLRN